MAGSDIYLLNAAYLRVKNIQIGYTLPKALTQKFGVQKLRVSVNTENPLTFTKNSFIDPESSEFGSDMGGIGPGGLGGTKTALAVNIETYPTHIAGLPVAVNICCHVNRHVTRTI